MKKVNFEDNISEWLQLVFNEREGTILMNSHMSDKISLKQGVSQGDIICRRYNCSRNTTNKNNKKQKH